MLQIQLVVREADLNLGPPDFKSAPLTTPTRYLHNNDQRAAAVGEIEQVLDVSRDEIISNWNTLRGQFSRELNLTSKMKPGSGLEERYESKWLYFQQMKFLQGVVEARKSADTLDDAVDDTSPAGAELFCFCLKFSTEST